MPGYSNHTSAGAWLIPASLAPAIQPRFSNIGVTYYYDSASVLCNKLVSVHVAFEGRGITVFSHCHYNCTGTSSKKSYFHTTPDMGIEGQHISLPSSYPSLSYKEIRLHHVPDSSEEVTPVIVLELYRPDKYNAFTRTMTQELEHAFTLFDLDDRVKCIVVTGHGRMFCAGADLDIGFRVEAGETRNHRDGGGRVALAISRCKKPVIGAIQGSAVGIGITMTLPMTIRVAWKGAKIGFVFARRGIVMEAASSFFLPRLIG